MEKNIKKLLEIKEKEMIKSFQKNNMTLMFVENRNELISYLKNIFINQKTVALGGSVTLNQLGVIDLLRNSDVKFIDRYEENITKEELKERFRAAFSADLFLTSTNALTIDGCLYNIDGTGNRVAPLIYGPDEVIVIAGLNKIFESEEEAISHIRHVSAPANAIRLNKNTPCAIAGKCSDCLSHDRICSSYVKLSHQSQINRIKIIIVEENLGY